MKLRTKLFVAACAAALLGVNPLAAQERLPAPGGAKPVAPPAPAHGAIAPAPGYHYQPACCQPDCCGNKGGCYVLAEAMFVRARSDSFDALLTTDTNNNATLHSFDFDYELTPRLTIGWSNCEGQGIRVRWFHYEGDDTVTANIVNPEEGVQSVTAAFADRSIYQSDQQFFADVSSSVDGNVVATRTNLRIRVYDIEGTQSMEMGGASLVLSAGLRLIDNESTLEAGEFTSTGVFVNDGYRVRFEQWGYGPTISAEGRMCLGGITAFVGVRTSYILSDTDVTVETAPGDDQNYSTSRDDGLFISEASLGAEWSCDTCYGKFFVRGAFEVQLWKDAGLATRIGDNFSRNSNLYLEGLVIGVGFTH